VRHMVVQPDGKIVIGGAFDSIYFKPHNLIARLNPDGSVDESFDVGSGCEQKLVPIDPNPPYVFWLDIQPDGKILIAGSFAYYRGKFVNGIVRVNTDGTIDETFQSGIGLNSWARYVHVLPNGQILLAGWFTNYNGYECNRLLRLNNDGTVDTTFRPYFGDKTAIYSASQLADGKMIVSGHSKSDFNLFKRGIARLNPDGSEDTTFVGHTNERTESVISLPDGKVLACGWFTMANDQPRGCITRFNADGTLDETFMANAEFFIWNMALDSKGRILVAGGFPSIAGLERRGIARLIEEVPQKPLPEPITLQAARLEGPAFKTIIKTEAGRTYFLECCDQLDQAWRQLVSASGTGELISLEQPKNSDGSCFFRVRIE
jgi:uncharacterized delta-60 repeat protein